VRSARVFLRYLHRERLIARDLSLIVEAAPYYRLAHLPRSITVEDVLKMLDGIDRQIVLGRRDYAMLLLLVTYGLRAREVAALTLDDIDWRHERLRIPARKGGHSTAYPLSPRVGAAILEYLKAGRPPTKLRPVFFHVTAPCAPITQAAVSSRPRVIYTRPVSSDRGWVHIRSATPACSGLSTPDGP